jgi:hypothetical protein
LFGRRVQLCSAPRRRPLEGVGAAPFLLYSSLNRRHRRCLSFRLAVPKSVVLSVWKANWKTIEIRLGVGQ